MPFVDNILQPTHLLLILVVALIVLGPKRLPEAGRALGKGLRDFRSAMSGDDQSRQDQLVSQPAQPAVATTQPVETPQPDPVQTEPAHHFEADPTESAETQPAERVQPIA